MKMFHAALSCACLVGPCLTRAQVAADTARLGVVVVTATRVPVDLRLAPGTVTVLDGAELRSRGIATIGEALRAVPGMIVAQSGSFGGVTSLFTRGGNSGYTKVIVDGVPVNDPGGAINLANLTTDDVARIEIVRGPASVLYGSDAVSGVVHILTRRGGGGAGSNASAEARGGSFGARELSADASGGWGMITGGYTVAAAHRQSDGIYAFNNRYRNDAVSAQLHASPWEGNDLTISTRLWDARAEIPTDYSGTLRDSTHYALERRAVGGLALSQRVGDGVTAHVDIGASRTRTIDDAAPTGPSDTLAYHAHSAFRVGRTVADARFDWTAHELLVFTAGSAVEWQEGSSDGYRYPRGTPLPIVDASRRSVAAYAQVLGRVADRASLAVSARRDDNSRYGPFDTYRVATTVAALDGVRVRLGTGTGFKEPSFYETFSTAFTTGNRDLRPERTTNTEGGLEADILGRTATIGATYFRQRFEDLVQYRYSRDNTLPSYVNVGAARASGVEATVRSTAGSRMRVGASYTFLETSVTDSGIAGSSGFSLGQPLVRRPKHAASVDGAVTITDEVMLGADVQYVGVRDDLDFRAFPTRRVAIPDYALVNLSAMYRLTALSVAPVALTLRATNLLDRSYESIFNFPSPRRSLLVGVRVGTAR